MQIIHFSMQFKWADSLWKLNLILILQMIKKENKNFRKMFIVADLVSLSTVFLGVQWLSGRVLDLRPRGLRFEPHRRHCVLSLSKNINPSLVLGQPRITCPFITERLLMGRQESNQINKSTVFTL